MSVTDHLELDLLRTVKLLGVASDAAVAARLRRDLAVVRSAATDLETNGLVLLRRGHPGGWSLTADGRSRLAELSSAEIDGGGVDGGGVRHLVVEVHRRFTPVNVDFLALCTEWQLRPAPSGSVPGEAVVNDHSLPGYDAAVIARLGELDAVIQSLLTDASAALGRFAEYRQRLTFALTRVTAGDLDWFTRPVLDSYHTVWFELHEDLLTTLGLERSNQP